MTELSPTPDVFLSASPKNSLGAALSAPSEPHVQCVHAARCGGCSLIDRSYTEQLSLKRSRVAQAVARFEALAETYVDPVAAAATHTGYRTRAKLHVAPGARLGFFEKPASTGTKNAAARSDIVDIPNCQVLSPCLLEVAAWLRSVIDHHERTGGPLAPFVAPSTPASSLEAPSSHGPSHVSSGALRGVDLREVTIDGHAKALVTLIMHYTNDHSRRDLEAAARDLADGAPPPVAGLALRVLHNESTDVFGGDHTVIAGATQAPSRLGNTTSIATYGSIAPAHEKQVEFAQNIAMRLVQRSHGDSPCRVLSVFTGADALALASAHAGAEVVHIDPSASAADLLGAAAREAGVTIHIEARDVLTALRQASSVSPRLFDVVMLAPPRLGLVPQAREALARMRPDAIAYMARDPETMARDLDHLTRVGFAVASIHPVDIAPMSDAVDVVAVLHPQPCAAPELLYEDEYVVAVNKGGHDALAPSSSHAISLLERVRALPRTPLAIPIPLADPCASGVALFAKDASEAVRWDALLTASSSTTSASPSTETRVIYLVAVRGITPSKGTITRDIRDNGNVHHARTRFRRLAVAGGHSILRVIPEQAHPDQLRRHLASIGHPVLGDARYGHAITNRAFEDRNMLDRPFIHCVRIEFTHPAHGRRQLIEAPLAGDLRAVLERTSGPGTLRFLDGKNALGQPSYSSLPPPSSMAPSEHELPSCYSIETDLPSSDELSLPPQSDRFGIGL